MPKAKQKTSRRSTRRNANLNPEGQNEFDLEVIDPNNDNSVESDEEVQFRPTRPIGERLTRLAENGGNSADDTLLDPESHDQPPETGRQIQTRSRSRGPGEVNRPNPAPVEPGPSNSVSNNTGTAILGNTVNVAQSVQPGPASLTRVPSVPRGTVPIPPGVDVEEFNEAYRVFSQRFMHRAEPQNTNSGRNGNQGPTPATGTEKEKQSETDQNPRLPPPSAMSTHIDNLASTEEAVSNVISTIRQESYGRSGPGSSVSQTWGYYRERESSSQAAEDRDLDNDVREILGKPDYPGIVSDLRLDYDHTVTRIYARETVQCAIRCFHNKHVSTWDIENFKKRYHRIRDGLYKYGPPDNNAWCRFQDGLDLLYSAVDHQTKGRLDNPRERSRDSGVGLSMSSMEMETARQAAKNMEKFDESKGIEDYITYFEMLTGSLPVEEKIRLLVTKMGPQYAQTLLPVTRMGSWDEVREYCFKEIGDYQLSATFAAIRWKELKQGSKTLQDYHNEVRKLVDKTEMCDIRTTDSNKIISYIQGLSDFHTRLKLIGFHDSRSSYNSKVRTLEDYMEIARKRQIHAGLATKQDPTESRVLAATVGLSNIDLDQTCQYHDGSKHTLRVCKQHRENPGVCGYCHKHCGIEEIMSGRHKKVCEKNKTACRTCDNRSHTDATCFKLKELSIKEEKKEYPRESRSRSRSPRSKRSRGSDSRERKNGDKSSHGKKFFVRKSSHNKGEKGKFKHKRVLRVEIESSGSEGESGPESSHEQDQA